MNGAFGAIISLYGWRYASVLDYMLCMTNYRAWPYLKWYWRTQNFGQVVPAEQMIKHNRHDRVLIAALRGGMFAQIIAGIVLILLWWRFGLTGGLEFGLALLLSYPIVWAHLAVPAVWLGWLLHPKKLGRAVVCRLLERQVKRLRQKHECTVVAVAGSIGKTSTKAAIAKTLGASRRVLWQQGNYNDRVTIPLIFFNHAAPNLLNVFAWCKLLLNNARQIRGDYPYDIVVVEFGPDGPNQMHYFAYIHPDLLVLTGIAPEHMEFFGSLDAVAHEELVPFEFSKQVLVNADDVASEYLADTTYVTYGLRSTATYYGAKRRARGLDGQNITFYLGKQHQFTTMIPMLGEQGAKVAVAAAAVASLLGCKPAEIEAGLKNVAPFPGRMQVLPGGQNTKLIDDTYNSSPIAAKAALDVLYKAKAPQRIAILGSMNELGDYSAEAHHEVGEYCNPKKLNLVVTIGAEAEKYLAPVAAKRGCTVKSFVSPIEAGEFVKGQLKDNAVILAKGSQNGVFAEEALKPLLADPTDAGKLVRQSPDWLRIKQSQFGG